MKKFANLGRSLSKEEQKKVIGGFVDGDGCTWTYQGCNYTPEMGLTCDYLQVCPNETRYRCEWTCNPGDGSACNV